MPCLVEDCNNTVYCRGYCNKHYVKFRRDGTLPMTRKTVYKRQRCKIEDCHNRAISKKLCNKHYQQYLKGGLNNGNGSRNTICKKK